MSFIEAFARLRICLFCNVITILSESSKTCCFIKVLNTSVLNNGFHAAVCLLQTNTCTCSLFPLHLSESQGMFNLGRIGTIPRQKLKFSLPCICSCIKHAILAHYVEKIVINKLTRTPPRDLHDLIISI